MAANIRPRVPYGVENTRPAASRLLEWLRAHPFDMARVKEQAWQGRALYASAFR
jgi:hypothetical protein